MQLRFDNSIMRPIIKPPMQDFDSFKVPKQKQLERQYNLSNEGAKKIVDQSIRSVYSKFEEMVRNTDYTVGYQIDDSNGISQISINMKNTGNSVVKIPSDAAREIAEKSKYTSVGLIKDFYA